MNKGGNISSDEGPKIDASYYFKNIDPTQIQNILTNFYKELNQEEKNFKNILM